MMIRPVKESEWTILFVPKRNVKYPVMFYFSDWNFNSWTFSKQLSLTPKWYRFKSKTM